MPETEATNVLYCTKCQNALPPFIFRTDAFYPCPSCGSKIHGIVFPSFYEDSKSRTGQALLVDTDASCFYHPQKKAEVTCDYCGRFLCALCEVELDGRKLCPPCIESGKTKGRIK